MRHEALYLTAKFISGIEARTFESSDLIRGAAVHKRSVIGEAAARLSPEIGRGIRCPAPRGQVAAILDAESRN